MTIEQLGIIDRKNGCPFPSFNTVIGCGRINVPHGGNSRISFNIPTTKYNAAKEETIELQQKEIALAAPKVQYVDTVLKSVNTYATNLIAKEMGMSAETLNKRLKEKGIQYRQSGVWVLTSRYQDKGYTKTRTHTYTRSDGSQSTAMLTVWTEQGREFLHSLFKA